MTIRLSLAEDEDAESIRRLARLDGAPAPQGLVVMADVDGEPVAALGVAHGDAVADPVRSDGTVMTLLRLSRWGVLLVGTVWGV
jgi:hypothetical protein